MMTTLIRFLYNIVKLFYILFDKLKNYLQGRLSKLEVDKPWPQEGKLTKPPRL